MMIVTKKHLSRRTMLRGIGGAAISLPLLDSMIPALTAQTKTAANVTPRLGLRLRAARRGDGQVDAHRHRRGLRVQPGPDRALQRIAKTSSC